MAKIEDGGPAFPPHMHYDASDGSFVIGHSNGMSLRDYFAAMALQGWLSGPCQGDVLDSYEPDTDSFAQHQLAVAKTCYGYADAMIRAREATNA
jgi:hypothetical protein